MFEICLWLDGRGEEAAKHYTSIFKNSRILTTLHHGEAGAIGHKAGEARTIHFEIDGQRFMILNGGPQAKFNESVSLMIHCEDQEEIDYYWGKLGEGGDESKRRCGWIVDKFGFWWQILPKTLKDYLGGDDPAAADRAMTAMLGMKKLDIGELQKAFEGK